MQTKLSAIVFMLNLKKRQKTRKKEEKSLASRIHSFFNGLGTGTHHTLRFDTQRSRNLVQGCIDPWRGLKTINSTFFEMEKTLNGDKEFHAIFSSLVFTKSLGVFSENQHAYFQIQHTDVKSKILAHWLDLANLFRVECVIHNKQNPKQPISEHNRPFQNNRSRDTTDP